MNKKGKEKTTREREREREKRSLSERINPFFNKFKKSKKKIQSIQLKRKRINQIHRNIQENFPFFFYIFVWEKS